MVANLVEAAQVESRLGEATADSTGILPAVSVQSGGVFQVKGPGNLQLEIKSDERGQLAGIAATRAGRYSINGPGTALQLGASLLSPLESGLAGIDQIEFSDQLKVQASEATVPKADRTLWWPLALLGLAVLLVEWWFFQRRPMATAVR